MKKDSTEEIFYRVTSYVKKQDFIQPGDRVLLGLSGGADSICLFYLLLRLREIIPFELRAVHVHHGIREEADGDAAYVEEICRKEGIFCRVYREDVPAFAKKQGLSEEEAGRKLRYEDFEKELRKWDEEETEGTDTSYKIATAHHKNDQAETVLFQLFRGSGLAGLRGILPRRGRIIRPLLCLTREEIEKYLSANHISFCEDKTNLSQEYSRNIIRHRILPCAEKEICQGAIEHIGKSAEILQEAEAYIKRQAGEAYKKAVCGDYPTLALDIPTLLAEDVFLQKQVLLYALEKAVPARKDIGAVHVEDILELTGKQGNGKLSLPGLLAEKSYDRLLLYREGESGFCENWLNPGFLLEREAPEIRIKKVSLSEKEEVRKALFVESPELILKSIPEKTYTKWFDYDKIEAPFRIRHRQSGDYLTIDEKQSHKTLKAYMIDEKIPGRFREKIWLIADGAHIMWVPGGRMSSYYKVTEKTKTILQMEICKVE